MRLARIVAVAVVAVATTVTGVVAAEGFGSASASLTPGEQASTVPAKIVPGTARSHSSRAAASATSAAVANAATNNWAGYIATGGGYTSVSANWTQPAVYCSSTGIVSTWVGLDGWGSNTVEQDGTGADCRSGSPQYYAWWQIYPTNNQQVYSGVNVAPGDSLSSTVSYANGTYTMTLSDNTQGWSKTTTGAAPTGSSNASAEVVVEAAAINKVTSVLPNFGSASFTGGSINGTSLVAAGAQPVDMDNSSNAVIAKTTPADSTGGTFTVTYTGGANVHAAYQAGSGSLYAYNVTGNANQNDPMMSGTSPDVTTVSGGSELAYQDANGFLDLAGNSGKYGSALGMMQGTSPSITTLNSGALETAFQANTGYLWVYSPANGTTTSLGLGMMAGTSPSITSLSNGGYMIAFQANTGSLWLYSSTSGAWPLYLGMAGGTSPAAATQSNGTVQVAFQANTGTLWSYPGASGNGTDSGLAMAQGTSPSVATSSSGDYQTAFQSAAGQLMTLMPSGAGANVNQPMMAGSSPAITSATTGGYEIAFAGSDGSFWVTGAAGQVDTQQGVAQGTSPSISQ